MNIWRSPEFRQTAQQELSFNQYKRFVKIYEEDFYLLDHRENIFYISGSQQTVYQIRYHNIHPGTINRELQCNCWDSKVHCIKQNSVCKHIYFLMIRVLKYYQFDYYKNRVITDELDTNIIHTSQILLQRFQQNSGVSEAEEATGDDIIENELIQHIDMLSLNNIESGNVKVNVGRKKKAKEENNDITIVEKNIEFMFRKGRREEFTEDECIICYDLIGTVENIVECPECHNIVHKKCAEKWLRESKRSCIFCRSEVWRRYELF
jgi:hypothetical protein